jgi:hypothetical protein
MNTDLLVMKEIEMKTSKRKWQVFRMYRGGGCKLLKEFDSPRKAEDYFADHKSEYEPSGNSYLAIDSIANQYSTA